MAYSPKLLLTARNEQHITQNKKVQQKYLPRLFAAGY